MFQKYIAPFNQAKKSLPYYFSLPWRIAVSLFLLPNITTAAWMHLKMDDQLADQVLESGNTVVIIPYAALVYCGLGICFIIEMIMLFFMVRNRIRKQGIKENLAQEQLIAQMQVNDKHHAVINAELSALLADHNLELKKSMEIIEKLKEEILIMNEMLEKETNGISKVVEKDVKMPVLSKFEDFESFSKIYPDKDAILKYIARLKWNKGYSCIRCSNETFLAGQTPYGRRCTKCGYDESATVNTIFHNSKILINKAFYMLILVYNTKGKISSYKLAELLDIRQSTCWVYSSRFKKKLLENKDGFGKADAEGWSKMVLDSPA
ncbi:hypothetical protein [Pedobacter miscanthi]|uniref:hypothetical protein n=1 Tax=Pedobacter miscanthi TaxID=2259170 RepID=UPI00292D6DB8|nr:hypothetical protein [Pedobacter miscanthi]